MRRINYVHNGGPEVLFLEDVPSPLPGANDVLVRTHAIGVTLPTVRAVREAATPAALGGEVAGIVSAVGDGVDNVVVGDRVAGLCFAHAYAEEAVLHQSMVSRVPDSTDMIHAVALVRSAVVARGVYEAAHIRPGDTVLVTAAASAVGCCLMQYVAATPGCRLTAAVSSRDKENFVRSLGAAEVVTYGDRSWGKPVDVVLDGAGADVLDCAVRSLAVRGRLVIFSSGGGTIDARQLLARSASVTAFQMAAAVRDSEHQFVQWRDDVWSMHTAGRLRAAIDRTLPLEHARRAHEVIESRRNQGKVVLTCRSA